MYLNGHGVEADEKTGEEWCKKAEELGEEKATAWGCDLSYEYVRINGDYRT